MKVVWAAAAAVWSLLLVTRIEAQARDRERRPLIRPRQEVVTATTESEPGNTGRNGFTVERNFTPNQLSSNDTTDDEDDNSIVSNSTTSPVDSGAGATGTGRQHGGGGRQYGGGRRQYGGARQHAGGPRQHASGGGARQFGGGGTRQYGGGNSVRQYKGGGSARQYEGGGSARQYEGDSGGTARQYGRGGGSSPRQYEGGGGSSARQYEGDGGGTARQHEGGGASSGRQYEGGGGSSGRQYESDSSSTGAGDGGDTRRLPDTEISRRQMDTTILLLQRLSDRLTSIDTLQSQRAERIDTINYRLTRIELQAEERKSVINELSNALRHRMETTDNELDTIVTILDNINSGITGINQQQAELKATFNEIPRNQDDDGQNLGSRLQAVMATIHGLRTATQAVKDNISEVGQNLTVLTNVSKNLDQMSQNMVTKQYLQQNLNEIKNKNPSPMSMYAHMIQSRGPRRGPGSQSMAATEPEDCWKLRQKGKNKSGVYSIWPRFSPAPFFVYCDMETEGGGWTVIQRREDGSVEFLREWMDYKYGFGNLAGEFWLGNENIHLLTNQHVSKLRIDMADFDQQNGHAIYSAFAIGSELEGYSLKLLGEYSGDAGDSLRYHVGRHFSTIDVDNDAWPERSCARDHHGAWWYRACETSNLNGRYLHGPLPGDHQYTGLYWYDFRGPQYSLWRSRMMIRRGGSVGDPIFKDFNEVQRKGETPRLTVEARQQKTTTTPPDNFNPDHDPYAVYEYPTYA
ncbi:angiopoietin-4-like isoform X2 [Homarus americanus]|uniref:angiopoietin-4-like isoform X2 n=1 Tax=Homarus americanus TaxID=6706 RepID=UPI001C448EDE|nr:angiopoietin-4-like isoform X2 [Homarus americanus]